MLRPFLAASCLCAATVAQAEPSRLSGVELRSLVAGATIEIDAPLGTRLPVRYARDGKLAGQARELAPYLGSASDSGKWWIESDQLCHKWKHWFNSSTQCFRLKARGRRIHWQMQDGKTGTATITVPAPVEVAAAPSAAAPPAVAAPPVPRPLTPQASPAPPAPAPATTPAFIGAAMIPLAARRDPPPPAAPPPAVETAARTDLGPQQPKAEAGSDEHPPATAQPQPGVAASAWTQEVPSPQPSGTGDAAAATVPAPAPGAPASTRPALPQPAPQTARTEPLDEQRPQPQAAAAASGRARAGFVVVNVAQDDVLNVRAGPSAEHEVVGELRPGSRGIAITGTCQARWCPVSHHRASGWVNSAYLIGEDGAPPVSSDAAEARRTCLTPAARALLERIEERFGRVQVISTCRPGATIAGTARPSRHASGNAVDFKAGSRRDEIVTWLAANHRGGGTMTYRDSEHIHVDIGRHYVALADRPQRGAWRRE